MTRKINVSFHETINIDKAELERSIVARFPRVISARIDRPPERPGQKHVALTVDNLDGQEILDFILGGIIV